MRSCVAEFFLVAGLYGFNTKALLPELPETRSIDSNRKLRPKIVFGGSALTKQGPVFIRMAGV